MRPGYGQPVHLLRRHGAALDQGRPGPGRGRSSSCRTGCGGGGAAAPRSLPLSPPRPPPAASSAAVAGVRACPVSAARSPLLPALWFQPDSATGAAQSCWDFGPPTRRALCSRGRHPACLGVPLTGDQTLSHLQHPEISCQPCWQHSANPWPASPVTWDAA